MRAGTACCWEATGADKDANVADECEFEGAELEVPARGHSRAKCSMDPHTLHFMGWPVFLSLGFCFLPKPNAVEFGACGGLLLLLPRYAFNSSSVMSSAR